MKMVPSYILDPEGTPSSERKVFELLEKAAIPGTALHSLNIKPEKGDGEADFVLITRFGVLVLEIKGGRVAQAGGHWTSTDRHGCQHALKKSPFKQAKDAAYQIAADLQERSRIRFRFGHGVVLPDSGSLPSSTEFAAAQVANIDECRSAGKFADWLEALFDHWSNQLSGGDLASADVERLVAEMRPSFDAAVPIGRVAAETLREIRRFSEEQLETIDAAEGNARLLCTGGAGTGKTFLLVELVKREAARGRRVMVCAWSAPLRIWIEKSVAGGGWRTTPLIVGPEDLQNIESESVDVLLVDEGQDLLQMSTIAELDRVLKSGMEGGAWRWFMDEQNQAGYQACDADAIDLIRGCGPTVFNLKKNCRNTEEIVTFTQMLTAADIGRTQVSGHGLRPRTYFCTDGEATTVIRERIRDWLEDPHVSKSSITVLVDEESEVSALDSVLPAGIEVSSIRNFKGLEKDFVVVWIASEHDAIDGDVLRDLYTGITRARAGLALVVPQAMKAAVDRAAVENHGIIQ